MEEAKHFLKNWGIISCTAFVLEFLLWWLTADYEVMEQCQYGLSDYVADFLYCALYVLVSLSVSNLIRKLLLRKHYSFTQFFLHSGAMLVTNILIAIAFESMMNRLYQDGDDIFWDRLYVFTTIATLLTIIYLSLYYSSIIIQQSKRNVKMQKELLKLQLDPHFVFNSLSTLTELISEDPELAETFTLKFSNIYRYIVNQLNKETVTITEEIRFIREYCDLLDIRHPHHYCLSDRGGLRPRWKLHSPDVDTDTRGECDEAQCPFHSSAPAYLHLSKERLRSSKKQADSTEGETASDIEDRIEES